MKRKKLNDKQFEVCMRALGYTYDVELDEFFKNDMCFLGNVDDSVSDVSDLMSTNSLGIVTYRSAVLVYFIDKGADFVIGDGAIDEYGIKYKKGLYCTNYRELFYNKKNVKCRKIED